MAQIDLLSLARQPTEEGSDEPSNPLLDLARQVDISNKEKIQEPTYSTISESTKAHMSTVPTEGVKKNSPSIWRQLEYGFTSSINDWQYLGTLGSVYYPDDNAIVNKRLYGDDFLDLTVDQRKERIKDVRNANIKEQFSDIIESGMENTFSSHIGGFIKQLATPTTFLPLGALFKGGVAAKAAVTAAVSGGFAAEYNLLRQLAEEKVIDAGELAASTAYGAAAGLAFAGLISAGGAATRQVKNTLASRKIAKQIQDNIDLSIKDPFAMESKLHKSMYEKLIQGKSQADTQLEVFQESGLSLTQYIDLEKKLGHSILVPSRREAEMFFDQGGRPRHLFEGTVSERLKDTFISIYDRIKDVDQRLYGKLIDFEHSTHQKMASRETVSDTLVHSINKFIPDKDTGSKFWYLISHRQWDKAENLVKTTLAKEPAKMKTIVDSMKGVKSIFDEIADEAIELRMFTAKEKIPDYWPHRIKYLDQLFEVLDSSPDKLTKSVFNSLKNKMNSQQLTHMDRINVMNKWLQGKQYIKAPTPSFIKDNRFKYGPPRRYKIDPAKVTDDFSKKHNVIKKNNNYYVDLNDYYYDPQEAVRLYIRQMTDDVETRRFFGQQYSKKSTKGGLLNNPNFDLEKTIGAFLSENFDSGRIYTDHELRTIRKMLEARFVYARQPASATLRMSKDIVYSTLLGNPMGGLVQIGDLPSSWFLTNISSFTRATLGQVSRYPKSLYRRAKGQGPYTHLDSELTTAFRQSSYEMEELIHAGGSLRMTGKEVLMKTLGKVSNTSLKTGFRQMDKLGKNNIIQASLIHANQMLKKPNTRLQWFKEISPIFGTETAVKMADNIQFVARVLKEHGVDAAKQVVDENTALYLFQRVTKVQPTVLGGSVYYNLRHPGAKYFYTLGSFLMKHVSLLRQTILTDLMNKDNSRKVSGIKDLFKYMTGFGLFNLGIHQTKHLLQHGEFDENQGMGDMAAMTLAIGLQAAKIFGLNEHLAKEIDMGKNPAELLSVMMAVPPISAPIGGIYDAARSAITKPDITNYGSFTRLMPIIGPLTTSKPAYDNITRYIPFIGSAHKEIVEEQDYRYLRKKEQKKNKQEAKESGRADLMEERRLMTREDRFRRGYEQLKFMSD